MTNERLLAQLLDDGQHDIAADLLLDEGLDLEAAWMREEGVMPPMLFRMRLVEEYHVEGKGSASVAYRSPYPTIGNGRGHGEACAIGYASGYASGDGYADGRGSGSGMASGSGYCVGRLGFGGLMGKGNWQRGSDQ